MLLPKASQGPRTEILRDNQPLYCVLLLKGPPGGVLLLQNPRLSLFLLLHPPLRSFDSTASQPGSSGSAPRTLTPASPSTLRYACRTHLGAVGPLRNLRLRAPSTVSPTSVELSRDRRDSIQRAARGPCERWTISYHSSRVGVSRQQGDCKHTIGWRCVSAVAAFRGANQLTPRNRSRSVR